MGQIIRLNVDGHTDQPDAGHPQRQCVVLTDNSLNAEWALSSALGAISRRRSAKDLFFSWPNVRHASVALAGYLTNHFPRGDGTLLEESLRAAFARSESRAAASSAELAVPHAYLAGLLQHAPRLLDYQVYGIGKNDEPSAWELFSAPLSEWARKEKLTRLIFDPSTSGQELIDSQFMYDILASRVLTRADLIEVRAVIKEDLQSGGPSGAS